MISVVIPVFNQARFIQRAVESVRAQNIPDVEILIVDDGSTDDTQEILRGFIEDKAIRCFRQENRGPSAARNLAIRESRGEWIAFLDGDDYWLPGKLEAQLRALEESSHEFAYCGVIVRDDNDVTLQLIPAVSKACPVAALVWGNFISTPTVIVSRSLLDRTGTFDEGLRVGEDWDLWLRIATQARWTCIAEPLVVVRYDEESSESKYHLSLYEAAIPRILPRFFESLRGREDLKDLAHQHKRVLSSHFSMLAKAHFRGRNPLGFMRYALRAVTTSPRGWRYLLPAERQSPRGRCSA